MRHPAPAQRLIGFTLVELLVVITIIVVLLSLLTPAMDRAIYITELTVCGANQKTITTGLTEYASGNKRRYPYRATIDGTTRDKNTGQPKSGTQEPALIKKTDNAVNGQTGDDDRLPLQPYIGMRSFNCVLNAGQLDYDAVHKDSTVFAAYDLWYGWQYNVTMPEQGMFRIGDSFTWTELDAPNRQYGFDLLVSDSDLNNYAQTASVFDTHPDDKGVLGKLVLQDKEQVSQAAGTGASKKVFARWTASGTIKRGLVDRNFGATDGSVSRLDGLEMGDGYTNDDERTVPTPWWNTSYSFPAPAVSGSWNHIPPAR